MVVAERIHRFGNVAVILNLPRNACYFIGGKVIAMWTAMNRLRSGQVAATLPRHETLP